MAPANGASLSMALPDRQAAGGFQEHLQESLEGSDVTQSPNPKAANRTPRGNEAKEPQKRKTEDGATDVLSPLSTRTTDSLLIHLPGGALVSPNPARQVQAGAETESASTEELRGVAAAFQVTSQYPSSASGEAEKLFGVRDATPATFGASPKEPMAGRSRTAAANATGVADVDGEQQQSELSFAARVQPVSVVAKGAAGDNTASRQAATDIGLDSLPRALADEKSRPAGPSFKSADPIAGWNSQANGPAEAPRDPGPAAVERPAVSSVQVHELPKSPAPLKDISIQVGQTPEQRVEVRIVERSGELRVAVRTGDTDLAHGLRQGLPEVVSRLGENGFRTETWHPGGSTGQVTGATRSTETSADTPQHDPQGRGGSPHQDQQRQGNQHSHRPQWLEELEGSFAHPKSNGATYGLGY